MRDNWNVEQAEKQGLCPKKLVTLLEELKGTQIKNKKQNQGTQIHENI